MAHKRIVGLLAVSLCLGLAGCNKPESSLTKSENQEQIALGQALFRENCSQCHEAGGRGDYLKRIPATLLTRRSASELSIWIEGRDQHREMPSFTNLSEEERHALAEFLFDRVLGRPEP